MTVLVSDSKYVIDSVVRMGFGLERKVLWERKNPDL
jgi:hypothetical protein